MKKDSNIIVKGKFIVYQNKVKLESPIKNRMYYIEKAVKSIVTFKALRSRLECIFKSNVYVSDFYICGSKKKCIAITYLYQSMRPTLLIMKSITPEMKDELERNYHYYCCQYKDQKRKPKEYYVPQNK